MRVDYKKLEQIAVNPAYRNQLAKDTSDVLANYLYLMSNLNADVDAWSASEMAMITNSLNRWQDKKTHVYSQNISVGDILMVDFGLCYAPELSYGHPALSWKPGTTSCLSFPPQAHHPNWRRQTIRTGNGIIGKLVFQTVLPMTAYSSSIAQKSYPKLPYSRPWEN